MRRKKRKEIVLIVYYKNSINKKMKFHYDIDSIILSHIKINNERINEMVNRIDRQINLKTIANLNRIR